MSIVQLQSIKTKTAGRVGRGISAGQGKTAGRGTKGQKSRSGYNIPRRFEGGQTALLQRIPRFRGMKSYKIKPQVVSWSELESAFANDTLISVQMLFNNGLIKKIAHSIKIIGATSRAKSFRFEESIQLTKHLQNKISSIQA